MLNIFGFRLNEEHILAVVWRSTFQSVKNTSKDSHGMFGDILFCKGEFSSHSGDTVLSLPIARCVFHSFMNRIFLP